MWDKTHMYKYIPGASYYYYKIQDTSKSVFDFFRQQVEEHKRNIDRSSEPTDFVDAFLRESEKLSKENEEHFYT